MGPKLVNRTLTVASALVRAKACRKRVLRCGGGVELVWQRLGALTWRRSLLVLRVILAAFKRGQLSSPQSFAQGVASTVGPGSLPRRLRAGGRMALD